MYLNKQKRNFKAGLLKITNKYTNEKRLIHKRQNSNSQKKKKKSPE